MSQTGWREVSKQLILALYILHTIFLPKPKNWVGLTVVNVRAVESALKLHENLVENYLSIGCKLIKIGISAATLKVVIKG